MSNLPQPDIPKYECNFCGDKNVPSRGVFDHMKTKHEGTAFHLRLNDKGIGQIVK